MIIKRRKLSQNLSIILGSILVFVLFLVLFHLPQKERTEQLQQEVAAIKQEVADVLADKGAAVSLSEFMSAIKEEHRQIRGKFLHSEGEVIREVSNLVFMSGLDILSIKSSLQKLDKQEEQIFSNLEGEVKKIYVQLELRGYFFQLVSFLETLREKIILFHNIDSLDINKKEGKINIGLGGNFYFLSSDD
jgi:hypothetical protein